MSYDFRNLTWADFEDLVRDLVGRELGLRFEAFAAGPDGGLDGRHSDAGSDIIIQAKHFAGSPYSALKSQMRKERPAINDLEPARYILATSRPLSPKNKQELRKIIGPWLRRQSDIFSPNDLNHLLRKYPEIEKANFKLWLSSAAMLDRIVHAAAHTFNNITKAEIAGKLRVYAPNPSLQQANAILTTEHVVIISGPPGVGKTTLAEMLSFTYTAEAWQLVAIRDLEAGLAAIVDTKKQVFLFDDFLGKVALDKRALSHKDSDLARFIKRVRASPNARFILTTRAYIFEEARRVSEHLADKRLEITKYVLDVGIYTRRIKARIFYNHLLVSGTPRSHISALIASDSVKRIVDHDHYNPRLIEWMTDAAHIKGIAADAYPARFIEVLDHPTELWEIAFRTHISPACQHLLLALYFFSQYGVSVDELRSAYSGLHPALCNTYGTAYDPKDFEEALRILEGGFITIEDTSVNFVNPSLRDYLSRYVSDLDLLCDLARAATLTEWAQAVWEQGKRLNLSREAFARFGIQFRKIAEQFPIEQTSSLSNTARIDLLIEWWFATGDAAFLESAKALAANPVDGLSSWRDGEEAVALMAKLRNRNYYGEMPAADQMANHLEGHAIRMIEEGILSDELEKISDAVEKWRYPKKGAVRQAVNAAILREIEQVEESISHIDSESILDDHAATLRKLARRVSAPSGAVARAIECIEDKKADLESRTSESESPSVGSEPHSSDEEFGDLDLENLFASLLQRS